MAYTVAHGPVPAVTSRPEGSMYTFKNLKAAPLYKQSHHLMLTLNPWFVHKKHLVEATEVVTEADIGLEPTFHFFRTWRRGPLMLIQQEWSPSPHYRHHPAHRPGCLWGSACVCVCVCVCVRAHTLATQELLAFSPVSSGQGLHYQSSTVFPCPLQRCCDWPQGFIE